MVDNLLRLIMPIRAGSVGTSRVDELIHLNSRIDKLHRIVRNIRENQIDIVYIIGGDGSMKAAHALWSVGKNTPDRPFSVVAIPKTMDNDVLWMAIVRYFVRGGKKHEKSSNNCIQK